MRRVELQNGDGEHLAYMTLEEVTPEPGEDSFMYPSFTEISGELTEEELYDFIGELTVQDDEGAPVTWDDEDYLDWLCVELKGGGGRQAAPAG